MSRSKISQTEVDEIVRLYNDGLSAAAICKILPYTPHTIINHLRERGIEIRSKAGFKKPLNEHYFEEINSEKKAYLLGYLMADGCITERKNSQTCIGMQLKSDDAYILEEMKSEFQSDNKIGYNPKRDHSQFKIHSDIMAKDLAKYGAVPRKTGIEKFPEELIPEEYIHDFIRGFFDGDGWFTLTSSKGVPNRRISLGFIGNYDMMNHIKHYLIKHLNGITDVKIHLYNDQKGYAGFSMMLFAKFQNVKDIGKWMYQDATIYLKRKKEVFDKAMKLIPSGRRKRSSV